MVQETGPRTEIPRPQEKALALALSMIRIQDAIDEFCHAGVNTEITDVLKKTLIRAKTDVHERLDSKEGLEFSRLIMFSNDIYYPGGTGGVRYKMEQLGYTSPEIDSFIQTVEATNRLHRV